ncbi:MAG: D-alanyl-D-alanine carboxypeptidase [Lentisphaeria bacterium]|nr:D-alanyl-D-alanine carboxypeptidase [Lentisphaeria bacterium]
MKIPYLITLAAGIALIHILIIFLVMNGGCASSPEKTPEKPLITDTGIPAAKDEGKNNLRAGKYPAADRNDVKPIVPADQQKKIRQQVSSVKKAGTQSPPDFPETDLPEFSGILPEKTKNAGNSETVSFGKLPPPSPRKTVLNRGKYNWKYTVYGKISAIPGLSGATTGILLHVNSRRILWAKNPRKAVSIASMSKIMTMFLACEDVENGRVLLQARIPATKEAMLLKEGVVWMRRGEAFTLQSLLEASAIKSANDAALLIAQYLGNGDSREFIRRMNHTAEALQMTDTKFYNPHGLPGKGVPDNTSTSEDMLKLSEYAMTSPLFRELVEMRYANFREKTEKGHLVMRNHNHLLPGAKYGVKGVKGIKTGYTRKAGFCVAVACEKNGEEFIAVVTGFSTAAERDKNMRSLLQWGFIRAETPHIPEERIVLKSNVRKKAITGKKRKTGKKSR